MIFYKLTSNSLKQRSVLIKSYHVTASSCAPNKLGNDAVNISLNVVLTMVLNTSVAECQYDGI